MSSATRPHFNCSICNQPLDLETAKVDDKGKPVHAECYVLSVALKPPSQPACFLGNGMPAERESRSPIDFKIGRGDRI
jgi:hypothetical protein